MALLTMHGNGDFQKIVDKLISELEDSAYSCQLVDRLAKNIGTTRTEFLVFEKYFIRTSSRASLSVLVTGDQYNVTVNAIASGGGQGAIFKLTWGSEESFLKSAQSILEQMNFRKDN